MRTKGTYRLGLIFQVLTGLMLIGFFFLWFLGFEPPDVPPTAQRLREGLLSAGYFFPLISAVYLLVGVSYVTDRFAALATIVLFPVTLNVFFYHLFLIPATLYLTLFLVVPNLVMIYVHREAYRPMLVRRIQGGK